MLVQYRCKSKVASFRIKAKIYQSRFWSEVGAVWGWRILDTGRSYDDVGKGVGLNIGLDLDVEEGNERDGAGTLVDTQTGELSKDTRV